MENVIKEVGGGYFCYDFLLVGCMGCIIYQGCQLVGIFDGLSYFKKKGKKIV